MVDILMCVPCGCGHGHGPWLAVGLGKIPFCKNGPLGGPKLQKLQRKITKIRSTSII